MATKNAIMTLYNNMERKGDQGPGYTRMETEHVVRLIHPDTNGSFVLFHHMDESAAEEVICEEVTFFSEQKKNFEWKVYGTDQPSALKYLLAKNEFHIGEPEAFMVLDLNQASKELFSLGTHRVEKITRESQMKNLREAQKKVWGGDHHGITSALSAKLADCPESFSAFVGFSDKGHPVCSAWITFLQNSPFAGLWGGATVKQYRSQGFYRAVLAHRAREAKQRGVRYLTIDASPMSQPIVTRFGFQVITQTTPCSWTLPE